VFLFGCGIKRQYTLENDLPNALQPSTLRQVFNTQPVNLKELSKCNAPVTVKIINSEIINEDVNFIPRRPFNPGWAINPYVISNHITEYLGDAYRQCRIQSDSNSNKIISISMVKIDGYYSFNSGVTMKINVMLPEKNITVPITAAQSALDIYTAFAYTIHDISWQIVNDPTIQDYITCR
jgi:hypothetical protein